MHPLVFANRGKDTSASFRPSVDSSATAETASDDRTSH